MAKKRRVRFEFAVGRPDHTWYIEEVTLRTNPSYIWLLESTLWGEARMKLLKRLDKAGTVTVFVARYHMDAGEEDR